MTATLADMIADLTALIQTAGYTVVPSEIPGEATAASIILSCPIPGSDFEYRETSGIYYQIDAQITGYATLKMPLVEAQQILARLISSWHWTVALKKKNLQMYVRWDEKISLYESVLKYHFDWYENY